MVTMNIKNPRVHELAHELAQSRGVSATQAVLEALEEAFERDGELRKARIAAISKAQEWARGVKHTWLDIADLYDENGLPK